MGLLCLLHEIIMRIQWNLRTPRQEFSLKILKEGFPPRNFKWDLNCPPKNESSTAPDTM